MMSVQAIHTDQTSETVSQTTSASSWTINVSDLRTVKVSNVSLAATERDIKEFFSVSGDIQYVEMQRESQTTQLAFVTFKEARGADMAMLLSGFTVADNSVTITPAKDYMLPPEAAALIMDQKPPATDSAFRRAEDVVTTVLAKGFVLAKDAIIKAKSLDERTHLTANASATVSSIDRKMGIRDKISHGTAIVNDKVREMDERFHVSEKAKSAFSVAEQVASNAGSAMMSNRYILTGASWISGAISAVAKAAEDVSTMTKEKIEKAEENKKATLVRDRTEVMNDSPKLHLGEPPKGEPPVVAADSTHSTHSSIDS